MKIHGTAKGAALSKKDFGVGNVAAAASTTTYTTDNYDSPPAMFPMFNNSSGGEASMSGNLCDDTEFNGKVIQSVTFKFKKVGSPSGNIKVALWDDSSPPEKQGTFGDVSMPSLSTSEFTEVTFDTNSLTFTDGWKIVCNSQNEDDSSNYIRIGSENNADDPKAGTVFAFGESGVPYSCATNCSGGCADPTSESFCPQLTDQVQMKVVYED